jgi:hypothetical protein
MPVGNNGEYARLSPTGTLVWDSLDITAGTGMAVTENAGTKQVTVAIDNLGVDTAQLAADAVTAAKLADDAVVYANIDAAEPAGWSASSTYSLVATNRVVAWQRGGELLGTAETTGFYDDSRKVDSPVTSPDVDISESNGPYIINGVNVLGKAGTTGDDVKCIITCDGVTVINKTISAPSYDPGAGAVLPFFRGPIIAKETVTLTLYATTTNDGTYCDYFMQRMD